MKPLINLIYYSMEKKESYRHMLPHFQQPGQSYFITWSLIDAVPPKALDDYTRQLKQIEYRTCPKDSQ